MFHRGNESAQRPRRRWALLTATIALGALTVVIATNWAVTLTHAGQLADDLSVGGSSGDHDRLIALSLQANVLAVALLSCAGVVTVLLVMLLRRSINASKAR